MPPATSQRRGLAGLEVIDEISLLCVPDEARPGMSAVTDEMVNQCERLKDRFAILSVDDRSGNIGAAAPRPPRDSTYGAIYYPWIRVVNPLTKDYPLIPPSGHVTGIYARTDIERGVHKAPANYEVRGMVARDLDGTRKPMEHIVTKGQQDLLNPRGVNVIRDFRADRRGIRVWGARTMSSDTQWKYVNVRRLFIFVEESIDEGTQWVVFEPNDEPTWARVRRSIGNFLTSVWRSGALMGTTAEEAFFVKCDRTTMTQDDIDNGRLICYIGIAPVKPAEFVIFRISQKTIEAEQSVTEGETTMPETGSRDDPYSRVQLPRRDRRRHGRRLLGVQRPDHGDRAIEYRNGNEDITVRKLPGLIKYSNITFEARLHQGQGAVGLAQESARGQDRPPVGIDRVA